MNITSRASKRIVYLQKYDIQDIFLPYLIVYISRWKCTSNLANKYQATDVCKQILRQKIF